MNTKEAQEESYMLFRVQSFDEHFILQGMGQEIVCSEANAFEQVNTEGASSAAVHM